MALGKSPPGSYQSLTTTRNLGVCVLRIVEIREMSCRLEGDIANALVSFAEHTVSLIAVVTDVQKNG